MLKMKFILSLFEMQTGDVLKLDMQDCIRPQKIKMTGASFIL